MDTVIIVIHLMVIVALVAVVLLQRSEGGALGIGGSNAFLSARGQGNVLTKTTGILAAAFFITSILLTVIGRLSTSPGDVIKQISAPATTAPIGTPATPSTTTPPASTTGSGGILDELNRYTSGPQGGTTTAPGTGSGTTAPATPPASGTAPAEPQVPTGQ